MVTAGHDEDVLRLSRPPSFSGKEDDWTEWSFVMRSYLMVQGEEIAAMMEAAEEAAGPDISMTAIERSLRAGGVQATKKMFHMLVMTVKGSALGVLRGILQQNGALAWRALMKRYEPNTAPRIQSLMSTILSWPQFPADLTTYETKLAEWEEAICKREVHEIGVVRGQGARDGEDASPGPEPRRLRQDEERHAPVPPEQRGVRGGGTDAPPQQMR